MSKIAIVLLAFLAGCGSTSTPTESKPPADQTSQTSTTQTTTQVGGVSVTIDISTGAAEGQQQEEQSQSDPQPEPEEMAHVVCSVGNSYVIDETVPADTVDLRGSVVTVNGTNGKSRVFTGPCVVEYR